MCQEKGTNENQSWKHAIARITVFKSWWQQLLLFYVFARFFGWRFECLTRISVRRHPAWSITPEAAPVFAMRSHSNSFTINPKNNFQPNSSNSYPNPMMWHSFKSSRRDDSNEWSLHRVLLRNNKVRILDYLLICRCIIMITCRWIGFLLGLAQTAGNSYNNNCALIYNILTTKFIAPVFAPWIVES